MPYKITSVLRGVKALCDTDHGVEYFNTIFGTTDCVVAWEEPLTPTAEELCTAACLSRCQEVDVLYSTKMFTDVTVTFPTGDKVIQFRDNTDRSNIESVCAGATALVALGQGATQMVYRTLDDVNQVVTAAQMVAIGLAVLTTKQAITDQRWAHKDAICAIEADPLKTAEQKLIDIAGYNILAGW